MSRRKNVFRGVGAMLAVAMLLGSGLWRAVGAEEKDNAAAIRKPAAKGASVTVVRVEPGLLVISNGKEATHNIAENVRITLNGKAVKLEELKPGDRVIVTKSKDDPNQLAAVAATRVVRVTARKPDAERRAKIGIAPHDGDQSKTGRAFRASVLNGMEVRNPVGEDLGNVEDLMIDMQTGKTRYAVVSFGGFLGVGDKMFAVPWEAFTLGHEQDDADEFLLILDVPKERLESAPGFDSDAWPATGDGFWNEVDKFYPRSNVEASRAR